MQDQRSDIILKKYNRGGNLNPHHFTLESSPTVIKLKPSIQLLKNKQRLDRLVSGRNGEPAEVTFDTNMDFTSRNMEQLMKPNVKL